jgi:hypothetical protein
VSFGPSDGLGLGGGVSRFDDIHGRTEGGLYHGALRYPSPFFDIGHTYLPTSVSQMLRWCRYYFLVNPLINAVTYKMAEYPITPIIFDEEDIKIRERWEDIADNQLKIRTFQIEVGLDYFAYGNAFVTIHFPFKKYLCCPVCKNELEIQKAAYKFRNLKYYLACEKCQTTSEASVKDVNIKDLKGIRLVRWNPEYIKIEHNEITGESDYFFEIPTPVKNDITMGKKHVVERIPDVFIEALRKQRTLCFTPDNMFHLKRPTIAQKDMGWGMPLILPVLKDTYYLQILRKAQEAIAQQHIVPLRILFPQAGSASADPYSTTDLGMWRKRTEAEIQQWRSDPNYIPILPLPIGNETIGGEGKALMLHQEMRAWSEQIVAGMHVPIEFVFGGMQYSGSNVSMRMLENQFLGFRVNQLIMVRDFICGRVADYMGWVRPRMHQKRFKMADDLQRSALIFQLNQAMKVSDTTLLDDLDYDVVQEEKFKAAELGKQIGNQRKMQLAQAALQGDIQVLTAKYQVQSQKLLQEAGMDPAQAQQGMAGAQQQSQQIQQFAQQQGGMPAGGAGVGQQNQQPDRGAQAAPGVPDGVTAYPENGQQMPGEGVPTEMQSPLNAGMQQSGYNLMYLARRVATHLQELDDAVRYGELLKLKGMNPQLYTLVIQLISSGEGSQRDNLNPLQSPLPEQKPPRRPNTLV